MSNDPNHIYATIRDLIETVTLLRKELEDIRNDSKDSSIVLAHQRGELSNLEDKFNRLQRLVVEGDVNPSLITQVKVMENMLSTVSNQMKTQQDDVTTIINELKEEQIRAKQEEREDRRIKLDNGWQIIGGVLVAILTFILSNIFAPMINTRKSPPTEIENPSTDREIPRKRTTNTD